ncbi:hypothetical protein CVU37_01835 [candidate division BRC1 bacterium HGW-BRC1-1]|jgi:hypothetical protein|nr:MAG: hypothetical protein CVU37_01835 [candidate division BRC1 bacterium HGW-BRC1-1]
MDNTFAVHENTRKRRRWGCTCGCLVFLIGIIFGSVGLSVYIFQRHRPAAMDRWLTPTVSGFMDLRLNPADAGMNALFTHSIQALARRAESASTTGTVQTQPAANIAQFSRILGWLIHPDVFVFFQRGADGDREETLTVAQLRFVASWVLARVMLNAVQTSTSEREGDAEIFTIGPGEGPSASQVRIGLTKKAIFISNNISLVREAVNAKADPYADARGSEAFQRYTQEMNLQEPPDGEDASILLANEFNRLTDFFAWLEKNTHQPGLKDQIIGLLSKQGISPQDIQAVKISANMLTGDHAKASLSFYCLQSEKARKLTDVLRAVVTQVNASMAMEGDDGIKLKSDVKQEASAAVLMLDLTGLSGLLSDVLGPDGATPPEPVSTSPDPTQTTAPAQR